MLMVKFTPVFKIRIVYKSGYTHDFWATKFEMSRGTYSWEGASDTNKPLMLGADEIAAVYQVGVRNKLQWK